MVTEAHGVRRVEVETWRITASGPELAGAVTREVTFLATDGTPFTCNQDLQYRQEAVYQLEGRRDRRGFWLRETGYQARPSPCDPGHRELLRYRGRWARGTLALTWDGGSQTLRPAAPDRPDVRSSTRPGSGDGASLAGAWRWQGRSARQDSGEIRVEIEAWALVEDASGLIQGSLTRTVTVFHEHGRVHGCSGDTFYRYRDRYTLRGRRHGDRLTLAEVAVAAEAHPCLRGVARHLDTATGALVGDYLVLTWRGQRRQVLRRADHSPGTSRALMRSGSIAPSSASMRAAARTRLAPASPPTRWPR